MLNAVEVHVGADRSDFFGIILAFDWPASHDRRDSFDLLISSQPVRDIDHHIPCPDDRHVVAHLERTIAEARQSIEMVDHILRVEYALGRVPFHANGFGTLRADRKHDHTGAKAFDFIDSKIFAIAD